MQVGYLQDHTSMATEEIIRFGQRHRALFRGPVLEELDQRFSRATRNVLQGNP